LSCATAGLEREFIGSSSLSLSLPLDPSDEEEKEGFLTDFERTLLVDFDLDSGLGLSSSSEAATGGGGGKVLSKEEEERFFFLIDFFFLVLPSSLSFSFSTSAFFVFSLSSSVDFSFRVTSYPSWTSVSSHHSHPLPTFSSSSPLPFLYPSTAASSSPTLLPFLSQPTTS
jgi:hypothetical protein